MDVKRIGNSLRTAGRMAKTVAAVAGAKAAQLLLICLKSLLRASVFAFKQAKALGRKLAALLSRLSEKAFGSASAAAMAGLTAGCIAIACGGLYVGCRGIAAIQDRDALARDIQLAEAKTTELERRIEALASSKDKNRPQVASAKASAKDATQVGKPGSLSRGARNYVNVKCNGNPHYWKGQIGIDKHGHAIFSSPEYSVRAGALTLRSYCKRHGLRTLRKIVDRFCTSNKAEYVAYLGKRMNLGPDEEFDVIRRMPELLPLMIQFETSKPADPRHIALLDILSKI